MAGEDDLARRLLQLFFAELEEAVRVLNTGLLRLEREADAGVDPDLIADLFRTAHSVKGAAMSAGVEPAIAHARRLEEGLAALRATPEAVDPEMVEGFLAGVDALAGLSRARPADGDRDLAERPPPVTSAGPRHGAAGPAGRPSTVRVAADHIDALVGQAGELSAASDQIEAVAAALALAAEEAFRGAADIPQRVDRLAREAATAARDTTRASGDIAAGVERLMLQPFGEACTGLERTVRDLARAGGKQTGLVVEGGDVEVDRSVSEALREPLLHLVRNAIDHGIEPPTERTAAGKPAAGTITLTAGLHHGSLVVTVADDGRGVDRQALQQAAEETGERLAGDELEVAFEPGVSTAGAVTDVSGRGVGLDVVRTRIAAVGGSVTLASVPGSGTQVTLTSPVNLALLDVLLVLVGDEILAVPLSAVEHLATADVGDLREAGDHTVVMISEQAWPVVPLGGLFGLSPSADRLHLVLTRAGNARAALAADAFLTEDEVVVKPLPERIAGERELLGVTVLADRGVALVVNPAVLTRRNGGEVRPVAPRSGSPPRPARVLVAEDTLTTRVLQQRILEAAGYEVVTAVDGMAAWDLLRRRGADVVITDVHMPNMDGIELCRAIRRSDRLRDVPVILVTSLGTEEDRRRGVEAGADAYIVKADFQAEVLTDTVERLL